jgi:hypothetical protein
VAAEERAALERVWQALLDSEPSAVVRAPTTLLGVRHLGYEGQLVAARANGSSGELWPWFGGRVQG